MKKSYEYLSMILFFQGDVKSFEYIMSDVSFDFLHIEKVSGPCVVQGSFIVTAYRQMLMIAKRLVYVHT